MTIYETTDSGCVVRTTEIDDRSGRVTSTRTRHVGTRYPLSQDNRGKNVAVLDWYIPEVRT